MNEAETRKIINMVSQRVKNLGLIGSQTIYPDDEYFQDIANDIIGERQ